MAGPTGIRREDKNRWEARAPLTPADLKALHASGLGFVVQPSAIRVFADAEYEDAGAALSEDISACDLILGIKEIPARHFLPGRTYVFFSHTIKAQPYNMAMLRRLMELGCTLVDYELIVDDSGRRTVFFGIHAGLAGMVETLVALGKRLDAEGVENPFSHISQPLEYRDLGEVKGAVAGAADWIRSRGMPPGCSPFVFGFTGYGNVSRGAQEILDILPVIEVQPEDLPGLHAGGLVSDHHVYKVVFREEHMVEPREGTFDLEEYYEHPERYRPVFRRHLPHLDVLVNCIFWTEKYPRLVTRQDALGLARAGKLRVVGDISCDIEGAVEITLKATMPDAPCFTYDPEAGSIADGVGARGIVIMAVDNLPCELPREASASFSKALRDLVPAMAGADWSLPLDAIGLPRAVRDAVILHRGRLMPRFAYLEEASRAAVK